MTTEEQRNIFAKGFLTFIGITVGDDGGMKPTSFAAMLAVTLGRFIHDYMPEHARAHVAMICANALVKTAVEEDDEPSEAIH